MIEKTNVKTIKVTQVRSAIRRSKKQKMYLANLGLKKMNQTKEFNDDKAIRGIIAKISHLLEVVYY